MTHRHATFAEYLASARSPSDAAPGSRGPDPHPNLTAFGRDVFFVAVASGPTPYVAEYAIVRFVFDPELHAELIRLTTTLRRHGTGHPPAPGRG